MSRFSTPLSDVPAAFAAPALAGQEVFRGALEALSRPGRIVRIAAELQAPPGVQRAAAALALALLDQDTQLWLSPSLADPAAAAYFRFHTGCVLAPAPERADFALVAARELPPLAAFAPGTDEFPHRSAPLIIEVQSLVAAVGAASGWTLSGPGMQAPIGLRVGGLGAPFEREWAQNHRRFPRGVDAYLTCGDSLCGLPRTTRMEA